MATDKEIRELLSRLLKPPLTEPEWKLCQDEHWFDDMREGTRRGDDLRAVLDRIRRLRKAFAPETAPTEAKAPSRQEQQTHPQRVQLIGLLLKADAETYGPVKDFRETQLGGRLIDPGDELESWLWERAHEETFELSYYHTPLLLPYVSADDTLEHVPYLEGGVLERLGVLALDLVDRYGWREAEATTFVLTGRFPLAEEVEIEIINREPFAATSRMVMTVDPAVSPGALVKIYTENRKILLGQRYRSLNAKHMTLARQYAENYTHTWVEQMRLWNETQKPEWHYEEIRNFHRDTTGAVSRILRDTRKSTQTDQAEVDSWDD